MDVFVRSLATGTLLVQISVIVSALLFLASWQGYFSGYVERLAGFISERWREVSLVLTVLAASGSLYMSNFLGWTPCRLCWFQRIFMYPLVLLFGVSVYLDTDVREYVVPMASIGAGIAGYHYIIQRISQFHAAGCSVLSVSCETEYTFHFGFINVPMMAFTVFTVVLLLAWYSRS